MMKRLLRPFSYITTIIFLLSFAFIMLIFHPLQMIGKSMSYQAHKVVVDWMMGLMNFILPLSGNIIKFKNLAGKMPNDRPMIIVSNHQAMYDITAIGWVLRRHHPKWISKESLAKGIPSISYNIRNGGSITIDRKDKRQSARAILDFCDYLNENNRAGCIFAEGKRSRDGQMRPLKKMGLSIMLKKMPDALVVPVVMENFWKMSENNLFPIDFGHQFRCTVLPPIDRTQFDNDTIVEEIETQIRTVLKQPKEQITEA